MINKKSIGLTKFALSALAIIGCLLIGTSNKIRAADIKLPVLGDSSSGIVSKNQEYKLGRTWLQAFRQQIRQHDDPLIQAYLEQLSFDLVSHSELEDSRLTLVLINNPTINAFAVPGGVIGIHTGIFLHADNEDQLASIISHEIAHLSQRHFARSLEARRSSAAINLAGLLATIIVSAKAGSDAGLATLSATQAIATDQQLRYSRKNEQEADRVGLKIMRNAGRNPEAAADMLEKMMALTRYKGSRLPEFLLTHPVTERRVTDTKSRTFSEYIRHYPDRTDYYIMQARAKILLQDDANYSLSYFKQKLVTNSLNSQAARYGMAIANANLGNVSEASTILADLLKDQPLYTPYVYTDIEVDIAAKQYKSALQKLNYHLKLNKDNYPLRMLEADLLWKTHQYEASAKVLTSLSRQRPDDPTVWYQLAEVRGLAGNISGVHIARAEYFILVGAMENAKRQLNFAKKLLKNDFKRRSMVKQRLTDIEDMEKQLSKL